MNSVWKFEIPIISKFDISKFGPSGCKDIGNNKWSLFASYIYLANSRTLSILISVSTSSPYPLYTVHIYIYRGLHKGWDFTDDSTKYILSVSFLYPPAIVNMFSFLPTHQINHIKDIFKAEDFIHPRNWHIWRASGRLYTLILCG